MLSRDEGWGDVDGDGIPNALDADDQLVDPDFRPSPRACPMVSSTLGGPPSGWLWVIAVAAVRARRRPGAQASV